MQRKTCGFNIILRLTNAHASHKRQQHAEHRRAAERALAARARPAVFVSEALFGARTAHAHVPAREQHRSPWPVQTQNALKQVWGQSGILMQR